jgi:hypothetical protein
MINDELQDNGLWGVGWGGSSLPFVAASRQSAAALTGGHSRDIHPLLSKWNLAQFKKLKAAIKPVSK